MTLRHDGSRLRDSTERLFLLATLFDVVSMDRTSFQRLEPRGIGKYPYIASKDTLEYQKRPSSS